MSTIPEKRNLPTLERNSRNLLIFTVLILVSGWVGRGLDFMLDVEPGAGPGMVVWITAPLAVSFALRAFGGDGWADLGIRPNLSGNLGSYALSVLVYPVCAALVVLVGYGFEAVQASGTPSEMLGLMAAIFVQTALIQFVGNIFEEAGFRGYLAPRAFGLGWHTLGVHGLVGLVWGVWYFPYLRAILAPVTPYAAESFLTLGPRFLLGAVAASLVYGELRLRTDSLWPAVLMQTIGGAFIAAVALNGQLVFEVGRAFVFMPMVEGLLMSALFAALGLALYFTRTVIK